MSTQPEITVSHGVYAGFGLFAGAGYGVNEEITRGCDCLAELMAKEFGLPLQKRGNNDGRSCGAFHLRGKDVREDWFGAGNLTDKHGVVKWHAMFDAPIRQNKAILAAIPGAYSYGPFLRADDKPERYQTVHSPNFDTMEAAVGWLVQWGRQYCPKLKRQTK